MGLSHPHPSPPVSTLLTTPVLTEPYLWFQTWMSVPARATGAASAASTQPGATTAPAGMASASPPTTRRASPWCQPLSQNPSAKQVTCPLLQDSPGCSRPSMKAGINTQHRRVAGAGLAKDRGEDDSQNPSALFPVTQESLYHPDNLPCAQIQPLLHLQG